MTNRQDLARQRAQVIMQVQRHELTVTEAATMLGVSRKTYYEWENRALSSMVEALTNRDPGRPRKQIDTEKEALKRKVDELQKENQSMGDVMELREAIRGAGLDSLLKPWKEPKSRMPATNKKKRKWKP